jgi:uncharacterized protein YggU (UPF0235/DUF167 family)
MDRSVVRATRQGVEVRVRPAPRADRDSIEGIAESADGPALKVRVRAAPVDGGANDAFLALLKRAWRLPRRAFSLAAGAQARVKRVAVSGDPQEPQAMIAEQSSR